MRERGERWMQRFIDRFMFCVATNSQEEIDEPLPPVTSPPPYQVPNKQTYTDNNNKFFFFNFFFFLTTKGIDLKTENINQKGLQDQTFPRTKIFGVNEHRSEH
jgi:hypothetical protein